MPFKKTTYVRRKRKAYRKKTKKTYRKQPFRRQTLVTSGFPKTNVLRLRYVDTIKLSQSVADTLAQHYFRANSPASPDFTGSATAHQPMGWDEWTSFYRQYIVIGSKIKVTGSPIGGQSSHTVLAVQTVPSTTGTTDVTRFLEQSRTNHVTYKHQATGESSAKKQTLTKGFSTKKFFNITNVSDNLDRLGASTPTGNPSDPAYFCVSYGSLDPADTVEISSYLLVEIEYIVMFSNPKPLDQS